MKKKYGIKDTSECVIRLTIGKANIVCNFTNGNLQSREPIPASYTTDNPIIQYALESCQRFQRGKIFIMAEYGSDEKVTETPATKPEPKKVKAKAERKARVMENVTTHGEAVTALMMEDGVNRSDLGDIEGCIRQAKEVGISFPNLKK